MVDVLTDVLEDEEVGVGEDGGGEGDEEDVEEPPFVGPDEEVEEDVGDDIDEDVGDTDDGDWGDACLCRRSTACSTGEPGEDTRDTVGECGGGGRTSGAMDESEVGDDIGEGSGDVTRCGDRSRSCPQDSSVGAATE